MIAAIAIALIGLPYCSVTDVAVAPGSSGDFVWIMVCSALVFMMVPALAFFYGGMLRKQSMGSIMAQVLAAIVVMSLVWVICGFSLAFATDGPVIGSLDYFMFNGLLAGGAPSDSSTLSFAVFQMMFAVITCAIIIGSCAERVRFAAIMLILVLWSVFVYVPVAHWIWGGGFLSANLPMVDFAGGIVIHILAGASGLALAVVAGPRKAHIRKARPHNIPFVFIGGMLLWVGWFGFNGGSGLYGDGVAIRAIFISHLAGAAGAASWMVCQYISTGRVNVMGIITGAIAGLGSITPMAGYVEAPSAIVVGMVGGILCHYAIAFMRSRKNVDDALDVFGLHGISGIWGSIATGIFACGALTPGGLDGLMYGGTELIVGQIAASLFVLVYVFAVTYAIGFLVSKIMVLRVSDNCEVIGQDLAEHGEPAYSM
ncbi:MAG: ammonium transporter [archaeon]|nr:ammonium transporter [archaeon]